MNWPRSLKTAGWGGPSTDGRLVFSGGDDLSLKAWDVELGELSSEYEMGDKIMYLSAAPQGSLLAVALGSGAVKVFDLETEEETALARYQSGVVDLSWSFDGRYLAIGTDRLIQVWDGEKQEFARSINTGDYFFTLNWNREANLLASGGYKGTVDLWSAESGENVSRISGHTRAVRAVAWSPQGNYLASGGEDRVVRIWDLVARKELMQLLPGHSKPVEDLAWSPDGTYLASGGHDLTVRVWNVAEEEYVGAFIERLKRPFLHEKGFEFAVGWTPSAMKISCCP